MWVHAHTDLCDFYRGALTLRQIEVRMNALPAKAALWAALAEEQQKATDEQREAEIRDVLAQFQPKRGG